MSSREKSAGKVPTDTPYFAIRSRSSSAVNRGDGGRTTFSFCARATTRRRTGVFSGRFSGVSDGGRRRDRWRRCRWSYCNSIFGFEEASIRKPTRRANGLSRTAKRLNSTAQAEGSTRRGRPELAEGRTLGVGRTKICLRRRRYTIDLPMWPKRL